MVVHLQAPPVFRTQVSVDGAPGRRKGVRHHFRPDDLVRAKAALMLGHVGGPQAVAGLTNALEDADRSVRLVALQAYPRVQSAELAVQALSAVLTQDPDAFVRRQAASTLSEVRRERAGAVRATVPADHAPLVREAVTSALSRWEKRRA